MRRETDVLIVGGGITALSLASYLDGRDYLVIEKQPLVGGYCGTTVRNGFVWDHSGHFFHFKHPEIRDYVLEHIDCEVRTVTKVSNIRYRGRTIDFPFQHNIHQLPVDEFVECLDDVYRCRGQAPDRASFKRFVRSTLGDAICDKFIIPYNEKLYACDLDELEADSMGRFFPPAIEFGALLARLRNGSPGSSYNETFIYPVLGSFEFVRSILKRLEPSKILTRTELLHVDLERRTATTSDGEIGFKALVSTIPFRRAIGIIGNDATSGVQTALSANKVAVFNLGFDSGTDNRANWTYFPGDEVFYRVGFYNNILAQERMSLYVEIGMKRDAPVDEGALLQAVLADLRRSGIVTGQALIDHQFLVMDPAYVHITGSSKRLYEEWSARHNPQGVHSIGRYGSWTYCSIEDNIVQARALARALRR